MTVGVIETQMSQDDPPRGLRLRRDLRHGQGVRLRLPPRPPAAAADWRRPDRFSGRHAGPRQASRAKSRCSGPPYFALVDEADSILIDEARTPLIIGALPTEEEKIGRSNAYRWSAEVATQFVEDEHYDYDHEKKTRRAHAPKAGRMVRSLPQARRRCTPWAWSTSTNIIERAIKVEREYMLDRQYVVRDGEIVIVDEFTGRLAEGRKWRDGIHQAVEAKEGVEVTVGTGQAARVTVQDFFLRYENLAGMTGTAIDSAGELQRIYRAATWSRFRPTGRPSAQRLRDAGFRHRARPKWAAIVEEVCEAARHRPAGADRHPLDRQVGRPLAAAGAPAASQHRCSTPTTIAARGRDRRPRPASTGRVTVSTNMAGRGTDIKLGDGVAELGGLHVILHRNARRRPHRPPVDRPLRPPGRPRHFPPVSWPWTTTSCWPGSARSGATGSRTAASAVRRCGDRSTSLARSFAAHSGSWSAAISASAGR